MKYFVIISLLSLLFLSSCVSVQVPVEQVKVYSPTSIECRGRIVDSWGAPDYGVDPLMQHMVGVGCSNDNQCNKWPPKGTVAGQTECCMNVGTCVEAD